MENIKSRNIYESWTISSSVINFYLAECVTYKILNESDRAITYNKSSPVLCDDKLSAWHRFAGDAGNQMPESCVMKHRCGTENPGWLNATHPAVAAGAIQAKVCFHGSSGCCEWSNNVTVRNCGEFYVYNFHPTPNCSLRYCGKINPTRGTEISLFEKIKKTNIKKET